MSGPLWYILKMNVVARQLAVVGCLLFFASCRDGLCTQLGCEIGEWLSVVDDETSSGGLRTGSYLFQISAGDLQVEWPCIIVDDSTASPECDTKVQDEDNDSLLSASVRHSNDGVHLSLMLSGYEGDLSTITIPSAFSLRVIRDDMLVADGFFEPMYSAQWVNGEGCSPYCAQPTKDVVLTITE